MNPKDSGVFISELRKENNLTQKQLAEKINVSDKAVSRWETGKGYPDVNSLVALSELFNVSVNEILSGERSSCEDISKIADENIITVIKENKRRRKGQLLATVIFAIFFFGMLLYSAFPLFKELFYLLDTSVSSDNIISFVVSTVVSLIIVACGLSVRKGNIGLLHSYHYRNVTDRDGYCKAIGTDTMRLAIPIFLSGFINLFSESHYVIEVVGSVVCFVGIILALIPLFRTQIKYNGGLF